MKNSETNMTQVTMDYTDTQCKDMEAELFSEYEKLLKVISTLSYEEQLVETQRLSLLIASVLSEEPDE